MEGWKMDQLQRRLYCTQLQTLLSTYPVLTTLEPELIGTIRGPTVAPRAATRKMGAIQRFIQMLQGIRFVPGVFDAQVLLDSNLVQVIMVSRSLLKALVPLTCNYDSTDRELTTTVKVKMKSILRLRRRITPLRSRMQRKTMTWRSNECLMGPFGAALLRDHRENTTPTIRAIDSTT